jgi:hypothetical protein
VEQARIEESNTSGMEPTTGPVLCRRPLLTALSILNMAALSDLESRPDLNSETRRDLGRSQRAA